MPDPLPRFGDRRRGGEEHRAFPRRGGGERRAQIAQEGLGIERAYDADVMPRKNPRRDDRRRAYVGPSAISPSAVDRGWASFCPVAQHHPRHFADGATRVVQRELRRAVVDGVQPNHRVLARDPTEDVLCGRDVATPIVAEHKEQNGSGLLAR